MGGQKIFTVSSNDSWTVRSDASWLTAYPLSGSHNGTINVTATTSAPASQRETTITVRSRLSGVPEQTVTVTQGAEEMAGMVFVQGGTFTMGCTSEQEGDCYSWETPAHRVTLSDYYIGKYEVTQVQWRVVMGIHPSDFTGDNLPVECVSWNDIQAFISKLNFQTGKQYRLPTEAEWEFAARGGSSNSDYRYSGSNTIDDIAWYWDNSSSRTHAVGTKYPNELGIYDMSGNVWEWCNDWWGDYSSDAQTNPQGPSSGSYRVLRGGSWFYNTTDARVSYRSSYYPGSWSYDIGVRLACSSN